ncbi:MAG: leucyl aminopeptidase [bacterium]
MKVVPEQAVLTKAKADVLIFGVFENAPEVQSTPEAALQWANKTPALSQDFKGKPGESALLYTGGQLESERLLLVGLGESTKYDLSVLRKAIGGAVNQLQKYDLRKASVALESFLSSGMDIESAAQAIVETAHLASYRYEQFKNAEKEGSKSIKELHLLVTDHKNEQPAQAGANRGQLIADGVNLARDLQNHPGNWLTPKKLATVARSLAKETGLTCEVLGKPEMQKLQMGALLAVAKGSSEPPRFIILQHHAQGSKTDTIVLVGKGITFDSGGISIKPGDKMEEMKFDMSGAAAVLATMKVVAELNLPLHVVGLIPSAENLPSATATRPGDILTASSGTTIEVINTDAEGRLILADALTYARRFKPKAVVDLATLTGACVVALGHHASGLMGNDQALIDQLREAGEKAGERVWPLPLWQEYYDDIKSDYADIKNSAGRFGGVITAAAFLGTFARDYRWAHLDIAGTAWTTQKKDYFEKGGTGVGVRLLIEFLRGRVG